MSRQPPGLRSPSTAAVAAVPSADPSGLELHRAQHVRHRQPWWFSTRSAAGDDAGRFDLRGPRRGTCYLASTAVAALLERVADPEQLEPQPVTTRMLDRITVWSGPAPAGAAVADVTVASTPRLTGEIATTADYGLPWQWADAFAEAGRDGIRYRGRFAQADCVAWFGPAGAPAGGVAPAVLQPSPATAHERDLPPAWRRTIATVPAPDAFPTAPPP